MSAASAYFAAGEQRVDDAQRKDDLLLAALPDIGFDGWSRTTLRRAAARIGMGESELAQLLPGGATELARWFEGWADRRMVARLGELDLASMKVRERVTAGVRLRLEILAPHREAVRRAVALNCTPLGTAYSLRAIYNTIDAIWVVAGDTATDFNFYTKRGLLAGVYATTLLHWLDDRSEGHAATLEFLDRRMAGIMRIPAMTARVKACMARAAKPWTMFRR